MPVGPAGRVHLDDVALHAHCPHLGGLGHALEHGDEARAASAHPNDVEHLTLGTAWSSRTLTPKQLAAESEMDTQPPLAERALQDHEPNVLRDEPLHTRHEFVGQLSAFPLP